MPKQVVTLDKDCLKQEMSRIWCRILGKELRPEAVLGIATGGVRCMEALDTGSPLPRFECAMRRPSTLTKKKSGMVRLLNRLPYAVTDRLRNFEDWKLTHGRHGDGAGFPEPPERLRKDIAEVAAAFRKDDLRSLVVIDDAVDSGATLGCVMTLLRKEMPTGTEIFSAVITQTRSNPLYAPDIALYHEVLCRFPWSFDFREKR